MESIKILIPTDFSVQAEFAYLMRLKHKLIKAFNTKFHLLQITSGEEDTEKASVQENMKIAQQKNSSITYSNLLFHFI